MTGLCGLAGKCISQNDTELGRIDVVSETNTKQGNSEHQDIGKKVQPNGQPSLHCDCHDVGSILQVESTLRVINGSILAEL